MFVIEDERHAEPQGNFASFEEALAELKRRAEITWDQEPNLAPCNNWTNCGRAYEVIEYDNTQSPWRKIQRIAVLEISASGVKWLGNFDDG